MKLMKLCIYYIYKEMHIYIYVCVYIYIYIYIYIIIQLFASEEKMRKAMSRTMT